MSRPNIDKLYIYNQGSSERLIFKKLRRTVQDIEYRYKQSNIPLKAEPGEIIHYAKSFTINDKTRTFLLITKNDDTKSINEFFKSSAELVKKSHLDKFNRASQVPIETDIWYEY